MWITSVPRKYIFDCHGQETLKTIDFYYGQDVCVCARVCVFVFERDNKDNTFSVWSHVLCDIFISGILDYNSKE